MGNHADIPGYSGIWEFKANPAYSSKRKGAWMKLRSASFHGALTGDPASSFTGVHVPRTPRGWIEPVSRH